MLLTETLAKGLSISPIQQIFNSILLHVKPINYMENWYVWSRGMTLYCKLLHSKQQFLVVNIMNIIFFTGDIPAIFHDSICSVQSLTSGMLHQKKLNICFVSKISLLATNLPAI